MTDDELRKAIEAELPWAITSMAGAVRVAGLMPRIGGGPDLRIEGWRWPGDWEALLVSGEPGEHVSAWIVYPMPTGTPEVNVYQAGALVSVHEGPLGVLLSTAPESDNSSPST